MAKNTAVFAIFQTRGNVEGAVDALKRAGFRNTDISVLFPENSGSKDFAHEKNTKAPEGTTTGVVTGSVLGGTLGWLVGIGSLAIPGIGPFVAAGPIMAALAGAGVGGAVGGITGALIGMDIPEFEAKRYEGLVKDGGILLSVHCDSAEWTKLAKEILIAEHGDGVSSAGEDSSVIEGTATDKPMPRAAGSQGSSLDLDGRSGLSGSHVSGSTLGGSAMGGTNLSGTTIRTSTSLSLIHI